MSAFTDQLAKESLERRLAQAESERDTALSDKRAFVQQAALYMSERDTALARVKELEEQVDEMRNDDFAKLATRFRAAESALASARELIQDWENYDPDDAECEWYDRRNEWLTSHPAPSPATAPSLPWLDEEGCIVPYPPEQLAPVAWDIRGKEPELVAAPCGASLHRDELETTLIATEKELAATLAQREMLLNDREGLRDKLRTALARVKELEAGNSDSWKWKCCDADHEGALSESRALAAESALASARELLDRWRRGDWCEPATSDWLSSHPSPEPVAWDIRGKEPVLVAAPCAGCAELATDLKEALSWETEAKLEHERVAALEQAIDAAVADLEAYENWPETHFPARALAALRAARGGGQ